MEPLKVPDLKPHPLYDKTSDWIGYSYILLPASFLLFFFSFPYRDAVWFFCFFLPPASASITTHFMFTKPVGNPLVDYVYALLDARPELSDNEYNALWNNNEERILIAANVTDICRGIIHWDKKYYFIPADSFAIMIELITGDLCEVECIQAIEEKFGIKFQDDFPFIEMTFSDMVDYIEKNRKA